MTIELVTEYDELDGYYYADLELPAEDYEIRDALQKSRAVFRQDGYQDISILNCNLLPRLSDVRLDSPTLDELKEQKVEELKDEGFVISNFHSGGVFYTMLMIVLRIKVEVIELLRVVLNNMFVSHAGGAWLDLKMADYSKKRKKAQKTQGFITVRRADMTGEAVKIPKGHVFKSILDINGEELRFFVLEAATLQKGASSVDVLVEAATTSPQGRSCAR